MTLLPSPTKASQRKKDLEPNGLGKQGWEAEVSEATAPQKDKGAMESEAGLQTESPAALPGRNLENVVGYCPTHHPRESWEALRLPPR